ncbi:MAG: LysM peptidoglycan-binding domain-containing protein [Gammaproteobacteria bacterium]|nr:LysM peptidoglycan-binding domain-containing protein [Gammaproteobacteria bacterium]
MEQNPELDKGLHLPAAVTEGVGVSEIDELLVEILGDDYQDNTANVATKIDYITGSKELDELVEGILGKGWEKDDGQPARRTVPDYTQKELDELIESILGKGWELDDEPIASQSEPETALTEPVAEPARISKATPPQTKHFDHNQSVKVTQEVSKSRPVLTGLFVLAVLVSATGIWKYFLATDYNSPINVEQISVQTEPGTSMMPETEPSPTVESSEPIAQPGTSISTSAVAAEVPADEDMLTITIPVEEGAEVDAKPPTREITIYTIVRGDTFWSIADRFVNNPYKYTELAEQNRVQNPDLIYPGNTIRIIMHSK